MKGILRLTGGYHDEFAGKKSEYPTKERFLGAVQSYDKAFKPIESELYEGYMRYYPKGVAEHPDSEQGEPFYMVCEKGKGAFAVWIVPYTCTW